jgi:hypothetical protein
MKDRIPVDATLIFDHGIEKHSFTMAVGDLASTAKGSGARANGGKPDYSLLNLQALADCMDVGEVRDALLRLGMFQAEHTTKHLDIAFGRAHEHWDSCARVFEYGKKKYAAWNWAKGMAWSIPLASAVRHLMALYRGEEKDPESGESHWGHVLCNIQMLQTFVATYPEGNDLPPVGLLD